jgi:hypothetical protein
MVVMKVTLLVMSLVAAIDETNLATHSEIKAKQQRLKKKRVSGQKKCRNDLLHDLHNR